MKIVNVIFIQKKNAKINLKFKTAMIIMKIALVIIVKIHTNSYKTANNKYVVPITKFNNLINVQ